MNDFWYENYKGMRNPLCGLRLGSTGLTKNRG